MMLLLILKLLLYVILTNLVASTDIQYFIIVEDGVWIDTNATIFLRYYNIKGCKIGVGAIVNKYVIFNGVYIGCPAKRIID